MVERFVLRSVPAFGELHAINQGDVVAERSLHPEWLPSKSPGPVQKRRYVKSHSGLVIGEDARRWKGSTRNDESNDEKMCAHRMLL
jgi:hypothetical protein